MLGSSPVARTISSVHNETDFVLNTRYFLFCFLSFSVVFGCVVCYPEVSWYCNLRKNFYHNIQKSRIKPEWLTLLFCFICQINGNISQICNSPFLMFLLRLYARTIWFAVKEFAGITIVPPFSSIRIWNVLS